MIHYVGYSYIQRIIISSGRSDHGPEDGAACTTTRIQSFLGQEADVDTADLARVGYVNAYMVESIDHLANRKVTSQKPPVDRPFSLRMTAYLIPVIRCIALDDSISFWLSFGARLIKTGHDQQHQGARPLIALRLRPVQRLCHGP